MKNVCGLIGFEIPKRNVSRQLAMNSSIHSLYSIHPSHVTLYSFFKLIKLVDSNSPQLVFILFFASDQYSPICSPLISAKQKCDINYYDTTTTFVMKTHTLCLTFFVFYFLFFNSNIIGRLIFRVGS